MLKKMGKFLVNAQEFLLKFVFPVAPQGGRKYTAFLYATLVLQVLSAYLLWQTKIDGATWAKVVVPVQIALISGFFAGNAMTHFGSKEVVSEPVEEPDACESCGQIIPEEGE